MHLCHIRAPHVHKCAYMLVSDDAQDKIEKPSLDIWQQGGAVITAIIQLLDSETMVASAAQPQPPKGAAKGKAGGHGQKGKKMGNLGGKDFTLT